MSDSKPSIPAQPIAPRANVSICFVCLGNICRSPTAEGVMLQLVADRGLTEHIRIDSAGTGAYHVGEPADARSAAAAKQKGVHLPSRARLFVADDLETFDYVVAMDSKNFAHIERMARSRAQLEKVSLLRSFSVDGGPLDVPDPYYADNFDEVFEICRSGCEGLLDYIVRRHGLPG